MWWQCVLEWLADVSWSNHKPLCLCILPLLCVPCVGWRWYGYVCQCVNAVNCFLCCPATPLCTMCGSCIECQMQQKICHLDCFPISWTQVQFMHRITILRSHTHVLKSIPKINPKINPKIGSKIKLKLVLGDWSQACSWERYQERSKDCSAKQSRECSRDCSLEQSQSWEDQALRIFYSMF